MAILSKVRKSDHFESHNSLKLNFTDIRALHSNFDRSKSFLGANPPEILALSETNFDDSIYSGKFYVRGYLPSIWQEPITHTHGLVICVKLMSNLL